ncbi:MAG TPA: DUF2188 domain-containing protein [Burkholderiales bacterium]|jgi:hypothetical protein|nr:hypothetical protein [Burkholderiales bacterium]
MSAPVAQLSVAETRDGVWSVNERGPSRVAVAYFPSKFGAVKHALRVARAKPRCRIAILGRDGQVRLAREYDQGPAPESVETP